MAIKYMDGFEQYVNNTPLDASAEYVAHLTACSSSNNSYRWTGVIGGTAITPYIDNVNYRTPQTNSACLSLYRSAVSMVFPANESLILGFGYRSDGTLAGDNFLIFHNSLTNDNSASGLHFRLGADGTIYAFNENSNTTIASSVTGVMSAYSWVYIELKISFSATTGSIDLRVNGNSVISVSGVNTLCGLASVSVLNLAGSGVVVNYFDDFYICDTTGSVNNDFLGPLSVYTLFPTANGSTNDFTPVGAATNWQAVANEVPTITSYVQSSVTGAKNLYQVMDLPITPTSVPGVLVRTYCQKLDNGPRTFQLVIKTSGVEGNSSNLQATYGTWLNAWAIFEKQADGITSWDGAAINNMEIGHKNT